MALLDFINPLAEIAKELRTLRELYELDLASREVPVFRITETPKEDDTEITYMNDPEKPRSAMDRMREKLSAEWEKLRDNDA